MIATVRYVDGSSVTVEAEPDGVSDDGLAVYVVRLDRSLDDVGELVLDVMPPRSTLHVEGVEA